MRSTCRFVRRRLASGLVWLGASAMALAGTGGREVPPCRNAWRTVFEESFEGGPLDRTRWLATEGNDLHDRALEIVEVSSPRGPRHALRLMADTRGTDDRTVKSVGVVHREPIDLSGTVEIEFVLDWNRQANGSYLSAGLYLAPGLTDVSPETGSSWLKVEYVGVPPGRNGRCQLAMNHSNRLELLSTEGWPESQKTGRALGRQRVKLILRRGSVEAFENGRRFYASGRPMLPFDRGYLYLQLSSHSNYGPREVRFSDVVVRERCGSPLAHGTPTPEER